jgi:hypothetical protein
LYGNGITILLSHYLSLRPGTADSDDGNDGTNWVNRPIMPHASLLEAVEEHHRRLVELGTDERIESIRNNETAFNMFNFLVSDEYGTASATAFVQVSAEGSVEEKVMRLEQDAEGMIFETTLEESEENGTIHNTSSYTEWYYTE